MTREEAHTLLEIMAINLTGAIANKEESITEQTKLMAKQIKAIDMAIEAFQDRPQGKWIDRSEGGKIRNPWWESHKCDQCGYVGSVVWNFCPNCGANMKGDSK